MKLLIESITEGIEGLCPVELNVTNATLFLLNDDILVLRGSWGSLGRENSEGSCVELESALERLQLSQKIHFLLLY
jgi:hypothetical protein